jgi:hypothetical protein
MTRATRALRAFELVVSILACRSSAARNKKRAPPPRITRMPCDVMAPSQDSNSTEEETMATDNLTYLPTGTEPGLPANDVKPAVGVPAIFRDGANSYAGEIVESRENGRIVVWRGGRSNSRETFTRRSDGRYLLQGKTFGLLMVGDTSSTTYCPES